MSAYRTYTVRVAGPDDVASETPHFADGEDAALEAIAKAAGYSSYRAWQADHPEEAGWSVVVEVADEP